jgi:cytidylate kinase
MRQDDINLEPIITKNLYQSQLYNRIATNTVFDKLYPTITVSRDPGSGGRDVAHVIAKELGIKCIDKNELAKKIALNSGVKLRLVEKALSDETSSSIESILNNILGLESLPEESFIKGLTSVVLDFASRQPAVILGSGINFILPIKSNFRVRVTAPRRVLVQFAMQHEHHDAARAREVIDAYIKARHDFVFKYFNKSIEKSHYYDVVVNTQNLTIDQAVNIILSGFKQKFNLR